MRKDKREDNGKQMKQYGDKISASSEKAMWRSEQKKKKNTRETKIKRVGRWRKAIRGIRGMRDLQMVGDCCHRNTERAEQ